MFKPIAMNKYVIYATLLLVLLVYLFYPYENYVFIQISILVLFIVYGILAKLFKKD